MEIFTRDYEGIDYYEIMRTFGFGEDDHDGFVRFLSEHRQDKAVAAEIRRFVESLTKNVEHYDFPFAPIFRGLLNVKSDLCFMRFFEELYESMTW